MLMIATHYLRACLGHMGAGSACRSSANFFFFSFGINPVGKGRLRDVGGETGREELDAEVTLGS